jgi:hypothetical protein
VGKDEDVELLLEVVERVARFLPVVDPAVAAVILFRDWFAEILIQVLEKLPAKRGYFFILFVGGMSAFLRLKKLTSFFRRKLSQSPKIPT